MAICLPGIASRVKRAATSDTRSAPFVMTMNCTRTMMRKINTPMTMFPWVIRLPKALMTMPASPPSRRISRVEETFNPNRNSVVTSSSEGKMENSNGSEMLMVIMRIIMDREIFRIIRTSSTGAGSGITRNNTMTTTISDMALFKIRFIIPLRSVVASYFLSLRR